MKRLSLSLLLFSIFILCSCANNINNENVILTELQLTAYDTTMKRDLLSLMMAYPEHITNIDQDIDNKVFVIMKSGKRIIYDDKKSKSYEGKLNNPDLQDMMEQIYPLTDTKNIMPENFDPGRIRVYPLLTEVYGVSKSQIQSNLTSVKFGYQNCMFNKNNKASESLQSVADELAPIMEKHPKIRSFVFPLSGTFNYRLIAGTGRLSPHSFGITIDLARDKKDYWQWVSRKEGQKRLDVYPREIVQIFEKNNFIWGGKWAHFDILHFEYRPELIIKSRYFSNLPSLNSLWYEGAPIEDKNIKKYIDLIDSIIK